MRRILALFFALSCSIATFAAGSSVSSVDIKVALQKGGSALITERWDITASEGTEWYLVRNNLGDIQIQDLRVTDEKGRNFVTEKSWDTERSMVAKARRCGLNRTSKGVEICWGLGSYGSHSYTVSYTMTNAVKSLLDADMLHLQLLSPGLSSSPQKVRVSISGVPQDTRFWGFGFVGNSLKEGKEIVFESSEPLSRRSSVIVLLHFAKGFFASPSTQNKRFEQVLAVALEGAKFEDEPSSDTDWDFMFSLFVLLAPIFSVFLGIFANAQNKKSILGCKPKEVQWCRDVPFSGNLHESNYTLQLLGMDRKGSNYASALILRMIYGGAIEVINKGKKAPDLAFNDAKAATLDDNSLGLYNMLKAASGSDQILQDREFSRWSNRNYRKVNSWIEKCQKSAKQQLTAEGLLVGGKYSPAGQAEARKLLGFKKFLDEFTLVGERTSREVGLWQDYLVYASLFGIADKVAKELHDIDPQYFEEVMAYDYSTFHYMLWRNAIISNSITGAQRAAEAMSRNSGSFGGFGGGTSFGGGGGFSGGGFGGGVR